MKFEAARAFIVVFLAIAWLLIILLNFSGYIIQATKVIFYVFSVSYLVAVFPDLKYILRKRRRVDAVGQIKMFIANAYRYVFAFLSALILFYFSVNLFYDPFSIDNEVGQCLLLKKMVVKEKGLLNISSFKIHNGSLTELTMEVYVKADGAYYNTPQNLDHRLS